MEGLKDILLISYVFPPYPGIGGRRWTKFVKYISQKGIRVHVICSQNPFPNDSVYLNDSKAENIKVYALEAKYPLVLLSIPTTIIQKLSYRYHLFKLKSKVKGSIYDRAVFWKEQLEKKATEIIDKNNIKVVIATGAPFRINYYVSQLKKKYPNIRVINDLRDPWTWGVSYGFRDMDKERRDFEEEMESQMMKDSDVVTVPVNEMAEFLREKYSSYSNKIKLLPHGYDPDEFDLNISKEGSKLIFYGTLYPGQEERFNVLANALEKSKDWSLDIYAETERYKSEFEKQNVLNKVRYHVPIKPIDLFKEVRKSSAVLITQPDNAIDFITTKIYEIIYAQRPIIYIGKKGLLWNFIEENEVGVCYLPDELKEISLNEVLVKAISLKRTCNVSPFSYENLTRQLLQLLK